MKVPLMKPVCTEEMQYAAINALRTETFLRGKSVEEFEKNFAAFTGVKHAVALNNGTSALYLSLVAMGVKSGDYIITTPATFIATSNVILYLNAKPLFVDIKLDSYNIDPKEIELCLKKNKSKVKAIIPVHLYGNPCELDEIIELANKWNLQILEDACQAHGAVYKNRRVGSIGNAGAFSFYPSKNMTVCGDGGMVTTNQTELFEKIKSLRDVGRAKNEPYIHNVVGYTARMNTVNAAIGNVQLKYLEAWNKKRLSLAKIYSEMLEGLGDIILPTLDDTKQGIEPVFHLYVVRTRYRDRLKKYLENAGVECGIHYPIPVHLQPPYRKFGFAEGMFPNTERWAKEVLSLPMFPELSEVQIGYVASKVRDFFRKEV
ncbi:MAG: DegT/DnrJ/EryC1/StrS family aminotransferase [Candidatus Jordarchaeaceae archaeon]